ncbi:hypothetical protein [Allosphingosinicella sp.]|jgi:hypothetical protein|uniref:hypothetical protein n=1 Tax=Allosphingosinicella sp. TaxID=2823234 RepID=UPI002EEB7211
MAETDKAGLNLRWQALLMALPAFAVYQFNDKILAAYGVATKTTNPGYPLDNAAL